MFSPTAIKDFMEYTKRRRDAMDGLTIPKFFFTLDMGSKIANQKKTAFRFRGGIVCIESPLPSRDVLVRLLEKNCQAMGLNEPLSSAEILYIMHLNDDTQSVGKLHTLAALQLENKSTELEFDPWGMRDYFHGFETYEQCLPTLSVLEAERPVSDEHIDHIEGIPNANVRFHLDPSMEMNLKLAKHEAKIKRRQLLGKLDTTEEQAGNIVHPSIHLYWYKCYEACQFNCNLRFAEKMTARGIARRTARKKAAEEVRHERRKDFERYRNLVSQSVQKKLRNVAAKFLVQTMQAKACQFRFTLGSKETMAERRAAMENEVEDTREANQEEIAKYSKTMFDRMKNRKPEGRSIENPLKISQHQEGPEYFFRYPSSSKPLLLSFPRRPDPKQIGLQNSNGSNAGQFSGTGFIAAYYANNEKGKGKVCYCGGPVVWGMVSCRADGCIRGLFHPFCIGPKAVPPGLWICDFCKRK